MEWARAGQQHLHPGMAYPPIDSAGNASVVSLVIEGIVNLRNSATGPSIGSQIDEFPDPRLQPLVLMSDGGEREVHRAGQWCDP